jgi:hypothetical protein
MDPKRRPLFNEQGKLSTTDFGVFYPTGYIIIAFERYEDAEHTCRELRLGGYDPLDCSLHAAEIVAANMQRCLEYAGLLARLGASVKAIEKDLQAAQNGATFLRVYAPNDLDAERVMNVVRRRPFVHAHRYHRWAIEDLGERESWQ